MMEGMYDVLEQIYQEYYEIFDFDSFHYGGDEVDFRCWNSSEAVTKPMLDQGLKLDTQGFVDVWVRFQKEARSRLEKLNNNSEHILWTSTLTHEEFITESVPQDYTIQIWTDSTVSSILSSSAD